MSTCRPALAPISSLFVALVVGLGLAGCAQQQLTPKQRYVHALNHKLQGDAQAYQRELIALAHDTPDSRAGRRARASLTSGSLLSTVAVLGVIAAIAIPNFEQFSRRAKQTEVQPQLKALAAAMQAFYAEHRRYCATFAECGFEVPPDASYLYYLSVDEVAGGGGAADPSLLRLRAETTLSAMSVRPRVEQASFFAVAVGDPDEDGDLDVWAVDENDNIVNLLKDD